MKDKNKKYPEGYFASLGMGIGIAVFSGLGILLCTVTKNYGLIGVGPAVGVPIGLSIGQGIEKKYKKIGKVRQLSANEKKRKKVAMLTGLALVIAGIIIFLLLPFFR